MALVSQLYGWYPTYTVLATDFKVRSDLLRPLEMYSASIYGLGEAFQYIDPGQTGLSFLNPAASLKTEVKRMLYAELGPKVLFTAGDKESRFDLAEPGYAMDSYVGDYYWNPYRELSHEDIPAPIFSLFYLTRLGEMKNAPQLGLAFSYSYDETQFYEPYDYWGWWDRNAMGGALEDAGDEVAYDDYRLRQYGKDVSTSYGYRLNAFFSKPFSDRLSAGIRIGLVNEDVDGSYRDFDSYDQSEYQNEYENYYNREVTRLQTYSLTDIQLGGIYTRPGDRRYHLSIGMTNGILDREIGESDTSFYHSTWIYTSGSDTNRYTRSANFIDDRNWEYDGGGYYLKFMAEMPGKEGVHIRYAGRLEIQNADLTESESSLRRSDYVSSYYYESEDLYREWDSYSRMDYERSGTGTYQRSYYDISAGADWQFMSHIHILGGMYASYSSVHQDASEPFEGSKYTEEHQSGHEWRPEDYEGSEYDRKRYSWDRSAYRTHVAFPFGVKLDYENKIELRLGMTRYFERLFTTEEYDVIVYEHHVEEIEDGVTTASADSNYVDGYVFPDIAEFDNRFEFNGGLRFNASAHSHLDLVFTSAFRKDYAFILSGSFSW